MKKHTSIGFLIISLALPVYAGNDWVPATQEMIRVAAEVLNKEDGRAYIRGPSLSGEVKVKSWKALRDERVVKQDLDHSCGAASLATLLNEYYGQSLTEAELLAAMDTGDLMASFEDMEQALLKFGFRAVGVSASYDQLARLDMPGVAYLEHRKGGHFSMLRGVNDKTVWLADPSLGNRTYSRWQFLDMWDTRTNEIENSELKGKVLLVFPTDGKLPKPSDFFTKAPKRQTALAIERIQALPDRTTPSLHQINLWP